MNKPTEKAHKAPNKEGKKPEAKSKSSSKPKASPSVGKDEFGRPVCGGKEGASCHESHRSFDVGYGQTIKPPRPRSGNHHGSGKNGNKHNQKNNKKHHTRKFEKVESIGESPLVVGPSACGGTSAASGCSGGLGSLVDSVSAGCSESSRPSGAGEAEPVRRGVAPGLTRRGVEAEVKRGWLSPVMGNPKMMQLAGRYLPAAGVYLLAMGALGAWVTEWGEVVNRIPFYKDTQVEDSATQTKTKKAEEKPEPEPPAEQPPVQPATS